MKAGSPMQKFIFIDTGSQYLIHNIVLVTKRSKHGDITPAQ